jgi:cGMP-dependent protein kinase
VNVIKADQTGKEKLVGTLQRGAYFGEQALLHEDRRLASIIANPPGTECLTLNRMWVFYRKNVGILRNRDKTY